MVERSLHGPQRIVAGSGLMPTFDVFGIGTGTVKSRAHRGRERLRRLVA
jgi:hypothetical protein